MNKRLYIRFGDIPENERSSIYCGEYAIGVEEGVSVYDCVIEGDKVSVCFPLPTNKSAFDTLTNLLVYENRDCYIVSGDFVGYGTDGEPLIKNVEILRKIKYREKKDGEPF